MALNEMCLAASVVLKLQCDFSVTADFQVDISQETSLNHIISKG